MISKKTKSGYTCPPVHRHRHKKPKRHHRSRKPITVSKILRPVCVEKIRHPVTVSRVLRPVAVSRIHTPVTVNTITQPVTVKAIENPVTIHPLRQDIDSVTIYGSNQELPLKTDALGRIVLSGQVQISPVVYTENTFTDLESQDQIQSLPAQDVSIQTNLSYAIVNKSQNQVVISLEISPNNEDYTLDTQITVPEFSTHAITPLRFLRYMKISYQSAVSGEPALFDIYYQAQSG